MYIVTDFTRKGQHILSDSSEFLCPICQKGSLIFRDYCSRIIRYEDGTHEWLRIPRHQCSNDKCRRIHRMLPDMLTPFKHYNEETISGVLDGIVTPEDEDSETCPSEDTMIRWHHWFIINEFNIEGHMKSIGYRLLGFSKELLETGISLLSHMRSSMPAAWLKIVMRYIYNSGNALEAFY